jgi:hypothetical protein
MSLKQSWQQQRQLRQQALAERQKNVRSVMTQNRQMRQQMSVQLHTDLQAFHHQLQTDVATFRASTQGSLQVLKSDVQSFLSEVSLLRQVRSEQMFQDLAAASAQRSMDVAQLFAQFAEFRSGLSQFRCDLHQSVWGDDTVAAVPMSTASTSANPAATAPSTPAAAPSTSATGVKPATSAVKPTYPPKSPSLK